MNNPSACSNGSRWHLSEPHRCGSYAILDAAAECPAAEGNAHGQIQYSGSADDQSVIPDFSGIPYYLKISRKRYGRPIINNIAVNPSTISFFSEKKNHMELLHSHVAHISYLQLFFIVFRKFYFKWSSNHMNEFFFAYTKLSIIFFCMC